MSEQILVTSGESVRDLMKNSALGSNSLDRMQALLEYSHMSPCSPFSLKCEMMQEDYLVIEELPCVFVAGGCEKTMSRWWEKEGKKVKLVAIK